MIIDKKKKIIPLKEKHVSSSKSLADEAVGVGEGGEGDSTMAPLRSPLSEKCKEHHCGAGARRRPSAETSNSSSSFVHHLSAPHSWGREWGGPRGASASTERGGKEKVANSIVGNQRHQAG